jgi:hypothetical protein
MRHCKWIATLAVLALAAPMAACGGGGTSAAEQPKGEIEDQLGMDQAGIMLRQSKVEAVIRDCMKNQGFDYVPVDPYAQRAAITGSSRLSDQDFLKQFGYGISTLWGRGSAQADPNARLRASLGPADRRAYDRALWGDFPGSTFFAATDSGDFTKLGGCTKVATEKVFGGAQVLTQLQAKLDEEEERINQDQRMVKAIQNWSQCMARAGFHYDQPEAIDSDLFARMEKIVGPVPSQFATGPAPDTKPQPYDHAALAALQHDEVAIAHADNDCEHKEITPVEDVVRPQYDAQFRAENKSLISQVKPIR